MNIIQLNCSRINRKKDITVKKLKLATIILVNYLHAILDAIFIPVVQITGTFPVVALLEGVY